MYKFFICVNNVPFKIDVELAFKSNLVLVLISSNSSEPDVSWDECESASELELEATPTSFFCCPFGTAIYPSFRLFFRNGLAPWFNLIVSPFFYFGFSFILVPPSFSLLSVGWWSWLFSASAASSISCYSCSAKPRSTLEIS